LLPMGLSDATECCFSSGPRIPDGLESSYRNLPWQAEL
jgi:hypothetical protein